MLHIISTPIGNLGDLSVRAKETLEKADFICCEDTRRTKLLLNRYSIIGKKLITFNDHKKEKITPLLLKHLEKEIALVSDNGTPGISDPGFYLVREWVKAGGIVSPVPGPSAIIAALVGSGLPTDQFHFYGFIPKTEGKRRKLFEEAFVLKGTKAFYESPYRIKKTLAFLAKEYTDRDIVIARELTKVHEEYLRGTALQVHDATQKRALKGEIVLLVH